MRWGGAAEWPWPVRLTTRDGIEPPLVLRPLTRHDALAWSQVRTSNAEHVRSWEPTPPDGAVRRVSFKDYVKGLDSQAREGLTRPFAIEVDGRLVGQMHLYGIALGSLRSASVGYWVAKERSGKGIATRALAAICDHAFDDLRLHRVEVNIRPENLASLRVVERLRFRCEGERLGYLHIDGAWRDHRSYALTVEDLDGLPVRARLPDQWRTP